MDPLGPRRAMLGEVSQMGRAMPAELPAVSVYGTPTIRTSKPYGTWIAGGKSSYPGARADLSTICCPPGAASHGLPCDHGSYLVDSASSHMLVSKIKPCMSKYKQLYGETANGSLYHS
jgi:hypothetical protein